MKAFQQSDGDMALPFDDQWLPLTPSSKVFTSTVEVDDLTAAAVVPFDYEFTGSTEFTPAAIPNLPDEFGIGAIVGASGTGKSSLLAEFGTPEEPSWDRDMSVASHFADADDAAARLTAVGLSSIPTWCKPYHVLSNGEQFRADLARSIGERALLDEFTSVVDRNVAQAASKSLRRWVDQHGTRGVVVASCHRDVLPWLKPDWVIDTDAQAYALNPRGCLQRPQLVVDVRATDTRLWRYFAPHHYMTADIVASSQCFVASIGDQLCGFVAILPFTNGNLKNAFRTHRIVVLPDFQGFGIGPRLHDWVGAYYASTNRTVYIKTIHPRFGSYLERSDVWEPTLSNLKKHDFGDNALYENHRGDRLAFSYRYKVDPVHRLRTDADRAASAAQMDMLGGTA